MMKGKDVFSDYLENKVINLRSIYNECLRKHEIEKAIKLDVELMTTQHILDYYKELKNADVI